MCWKKISSTLKLVVAFDKYEEPRSKIAYLKREIEERKRALESRSSIIEEILPSRSARKLSIAQTRRLKTIKNAAAYHARALDILSEELGKEKRAARVRFLKLLPSRIIIFSLLTLFMIPTLEAAKHGWTLTISSFFFTLLYVYTYKFVENRYIRPINFTGIRSRRLFAFFVYFNRWIFFLAFLFLQAIVLVDWQILTPSSGPAIVAVFLLSFLAAIYLELANIQKAFDFRIKYPKHQFWRDIVYAFYLYPILYVFVHVIVYSFFIGASSLELDEPYKRLAQEVGSGAVVASSFAALVNLYFRQIKTWFS